MIYEARLTADPLGQGDILEECALVYWTAERNQDGKPMPLTKKDPPLLR